jgi:hypothetical protein
MRQAVGLASESCSIALRVLSGHELASSCRSWYRGAQLRLVSGRGVASAPGALAESTCRIIFCGRAILRHDPPRRTDCPGPPRPAHRRTAARLAFAGGIAFRRNRESVAHSGLCRRRSSTAACSDRCGRKSLHRGRTPRGPAVWFGALLGHSRAVLHHTASPTRSCDRQRTKPSAGASCLARFEEPQPHAHQRNTVVCTATLRGGVPPGALGHVPIAVAPSTIVSRHGMYVGAAQRLPSTKAGDCCSTSRALRAGANRKVLCTPPLCQAEHLQVARVDLAAR